MYYYKLLFFIIKTQIAENVNSLTWVWEIDSGCHNTGAYAHTHNCWPVNIQEYEYINSVHLHNYIIHHAFACNI